MGAYALARDAEGGVAEALPRGVTVCRVGT